MLGDVAGLDVVELGCGTAYFSAWLARARRASRRRRHHARAARDGAADDGEDRHRVPARRGRRRRHGAARRELRPRRSRSTARRSGSIPYRWIPEAARLLRPGGRLVFLCNSPLVVLCSDDAGAATADAAAPALRDAPLRVGRRGRRRVPPAARASGSSCCARTGFEVERLIEVQAPPDAETHEFYAYVTAEWARQWPAEDIWVARKVA